MEIITRYGIMSDEKMPHGVYCVVKPSGHMNGMYIQVIDGYSTFIVYDDDVYVTLVDCMQLIGPLLPIEYDPIHIYNEHDTLKDHYYFNVFQTNRDKMMNGLLDNDLAIPTFLYSQYAYTTTMPGTDKGGLILIAGPANRGKTTMLLQICSNLESNLITHNEEVVPTQEEGVSQRNMVGGCITIDRSETASSNGIIIDGAGYLLYSKLETTTGGWRWGQERSLLTLSMYGRMMRQWFVISLLAPDVKNWEHGLRAIGVINIWLLDGYMASVRTRGGTMTTMRNEDASKYVTDYIGGDVKQKTLNTFFI